MRQLDRELEGGCFGGSSRYVGLLDGEREETAMHSTCVPYYQSIALASWQQHASFCELIGRIRALHMLLRYTLDGLDTAVRKIYQLVYA